MADPGFPVGGGVDLVGGGVHSRGGYISKILYVKIKESRPLGGVRRAYINVDPPVIFSHKTSRQGDRHLGFLRFFSLFVRILIPYAVSRSGGSRISHRGGVDLVRGAVDPRGGYVSKFLHVKTKESGSVGGARPP